MNVVAAQGDTWGISGPAFAGLYLLAAVVVVAGTLLIRGGTRGGHGLVRGLHPYEVAYLMGGRRRAIATAVAGLRADGALAASGVGRLQATAAPRTMRTPLDLAVHETVRSGRLASPRRLETDGEILRAVEGLQEGLVRDGLAPGPRERARSRLAVLFPAALFAVGVARLVAGAANGRPVGFLVMILFALGVAMLVMLAARPHALRSGTSAVRAARAASAHLDPSMSPAWTTYGATGAALAVALFGMAALTSIDPQFAAAAGLQRQLALAAARSGTGGGSSGGGGSSCGGGGGCGGGGCGG